MPNVTLSIPEALHEKMRMHSEIRWSEVVRKSISDKIHDLELMNQLTKKSKLTQSDVDAIASKINRDVFKGLNKR
ncbi:hypothetical protein HYU50_00785 [Candidatus Woesearchaeota archaeon]|nr:hypothetical protein [Candidatus Woesearchaeota archaeon]